MVLPEGFAYEGKTFGNLSEIASLITGVRWNGPRFFGMRSKTQESDVAAAPDQSNSTTRKAGAASGRSSHLSSGSDDRKRSTGSTEKVASTGDRHGS
jgi:hypothetical protein